MGYNIILFYNNLSSLTTLLYKKYKKERQKINLCIQLVINF